MSRPEPGTVEDLQASYVRAVVHGFDGMAQWLADRLDGGARAERARQDAPGSLAAAARFYARTGLAVFPLAPGAKVPLGGTCCGGTHASGCRDALANERAAAYWWRQHPYANVGVATGWSVDVIDVDGTPGWRSWLDGEGWPPVIGSVSTPRPGGVHRFIRATGRSNGQRIAPGIDYRGRGGYVVAPPSYVQTSSYRGRYRWLTPLAMPTR